MQRSGRTRKSASTLRGFANMLLIEGSGLLAIAAMLGAPLDGLSPPAGQNQNHSVACCSWGASTPMAAILRFLQISE
ncbi:hypothetical protein LOC68_14925 [Blastopirellula sp. JC732]|uniref:Uncharacterized protein n=1 Tax=Blastopirellula sediminis TaxID=2894196 RepID=A0A9X1SKF1_9BACT|nr:hypothetical protein [Blastopirellula sediminis]MCC9607023.1 hypothetical protein [Blastopirellula sediminis]MCC9629684.1 hypothetical protein [Blastopirellula sediminis]